MVFWTTPDRQGGLSTDCPESIREPVMEPIMDNNPTSAVSALTIKQGFSVSRSISAALAALLMVLALPASAILIIEPQVTDILDRDGDGKASSFTVRASADMNINEKGDPYGGGAFEKRGHPSFIVLFNTRQGKVDSGMYTQPGRNRSEPFTLRFSRKDMEEVLQLAKVRGESKRTIANLKGVMNGDIAVQSLELRYLESDTPPQRNERFKGQWKWDPNNDARVSNAQIPLDEPLRLEKPEKDRSARVLISSDPEGATVYIDNERVGETPLVREFPVDLDLVKSQMPLRLEKEGYQPVERLPNFTPPAERHYTLQKSVGKIALDSEPAGATVRINGTKAGETPMSTERHSLDQVDIRVEMEGYKTAHFDDVSAPFEREVTLELTDERQAAAAEAAARTADRVSGRLPGGTDIGASVGRANLPESGDVPNLDLNNTDGTSASLSVEMTGTWETNFGTLRLHQFQGYVVGDYADKGMIAGRVTGNCAAGVFTNGSRSGHFRFTVEDRGQFDGQWAWHGEALDGGWSGERTSSDAPARYRNFSVDGTWIQTGDSDRTVYDGTWDSDRGPVKLLARDQLLVGDYGGDGVLAGLWSGNAFVGLFTEDGRTGRFELRFFSRNGAFRDGHWYWLGEADDTRDWSLERRDPDTPSPDNMATDAPCR